jgi:hypothetical protein
MSHRPTVLICRGSHCRNAKRYDALLEVLAPVADLKEVRCQKICEGPVAGIEVQGTLEWFHRLDTDKARRQLVALVADDDNLRKALKKRLVRKRSGHLR